MSILFFLHFIFFFKNQKKKQLRKQLVIFCASFSVRFMSVNDSHRNHLSFEHWANEKIHAPEIHRWRDFKLLIFLSYAIHFSSLSPSYFIARRFSKINSEEEETKKDAFEPQLQPSGFPFQNEWEFKLKRYTLNVFCFAFDGVASFSWRNFHETIWKSS